MRSIEKKVLLGFIASIVSCAVQWSTPFVAEPTDIPSLVTTIAFVLWFIVNIVGVIWSGVFLIALQVIRLISKYNSVKKHSLNNPGTVRFPRFFRFMNWLNTDD